MQTISLDISQRGIIPLLYAKQGDVGRKFKAVFTDAGTSYKIPDGAAVSVWYSGASGEGNYTEIGEDSAISVSENTITVELITQMLTNPGAGMLCLVISSADGDDIGSWNIPYNVEHRPGMGSAEAQAYFTAFSNAVQNLPYPDASLTIAGKAADAATTGTALAGKAPAGYGLGARSKMLYGADLDTITLNGWYSWTTDTTNTPFSVGTMLVLTRGEGNSHEYVFQVAFNDATYRSQIKIRKRTQGTWREWEWINPPMLPGVEYRTIERWNEKVKYKKLIEYTNTTAISSSVTLYIPHGITNLHMMLTAQCTTDGYLLPYLTAGSSLGLSAWDGTKLVMYGNSNWGAGRKWYIEMCYTKTTD